MMQISQFDANSLVKWLENKKPRTKAGLHIGPIKNLKNSCGNLFFSQIVPPVNPETAVSGNDSVCLDSGMWIAACFVRPFEVEKCKYLQAFWLR